MNELRSPLLPLVALMVLVLAACTGGASTPSAAASVAAPASEAPSLAASEAAEPSEAASEAAGEEVRVMLESFAFEPSELTVAAGTEVTFLNGDSAPHTVTEGVDGQAAENPIIDEEIAGNQATSFTFDEPGTYEITCLFHPTMNMTVTVEG